MKQRTAALGLAVFLLLAALIPAQALTSNPAQLLCADEPYNPLAQTLQATTPITCHSGFQLPRSGSSDLVELFDTQALPALAQGFATHWQPLYLATVVIAIDRSQTNAIITGWADLAAAGEPVGMSDTGVLLAHQLAAISHAREGDAFRLSSGATILETLYSRQLLRFGDYEVPVLICFDYQAAALQLAGRPMEIIIPAEGTLCFTKGFLSRSAEWPPPAPALLTAAGFRLPDGSCDSALYPPAADYARAIQLTDYSHFNTAARDTTRIIRREVRHVRLFTSADGREHQLYALAYMIVVVLWTGSIMHRAMQQGVRRAVLTCSGLLVGWVAVRMIKYQMLSASTANRYAWYLFYLFQIGIPLVILWLAWVMDKQPDTVRPPSWWLALCGIGAALFFTVLTNDLHGLTFVLDLTRSDWSSNYSYGPVYYLIFAVIFLELLLSQVMIVRKSRQTVGRAGVLVLLSFYLLLMVYSAGYALRIPPFWESDVTITVGMFTLLFFEVGIRMGLVPMNTGYRHFFAQSPQKLRITDFTGETVLASADAEPLERRTVLRLLNSEGPVPFGADDLLFGSHISGGMVVWQEDMSSLNRLQRHLELSVEQLCAANPLLVREEELGSKLAAAQARTALFAGLEKEIRHHLEELSALLLAVPEEGETRQPYLTRVALLVCYIKRRCNLSFPMEDQAATADAELAVYLDELAEVAGLAGLQAFCVYQLDHSVSLRRFTLMYDLFYAVLSHMQQQGGSVFLQVLEESGETVMKLLLDESCPIASDPAFTAQVAEESGRLLVKELFGAVGVQLRFQREETADE